MMKVGMAMITEAMIRQRIERCSRFWSLRDRSSIEGSFSIDGVNLSVCSAANIVRNVTSGGEGLYRTIITGSPVEIGVKSMTPRMFSNLSTTSEGQSLELE